MEIKNFWNIKKPIDRKKMNWAQAKWANPRLRPMGDWDNDGVKNQFDCKPMNRKRQHDLKPGEARYLEETLGPEGIVAMSREELKRHRDD